MIDEKKGQRNKSESKVCFFSFCIYGDFDGIIRQSAVLEGCAWRGIRSGGEKSAD